MIELPYGYAGLGKAPQELLRRAILESDGDYLELGAGDGGSACVAALALKERGSGIAVTVDVFHPKAIRRLCQNAAHFGVDDKIAALRAMVPPWPGSVLRHEWGVVLFDGAHDISELFAWREIKHLLTGWLLVDNVEKLYPRAIVNEALEDGWTLVDEVEGVSQKYPDGTPNLFSALRLT